MTPPEVIARLRELEAKASPAPWERDANETTSDEVHNYMASADNKCLFDSLNSDTRVIDYDVDDGRAYYRDIGTRDDFDFIAELRNAASSLISDAESLAAAEARVKELDAEVERLRPFEPRVLPSNWPHEAKIAHAKGFMEPLVLAFDAMNGECNYTETCVRHGSKEYTVTVRRGDKPTPHELRMAAEARVRELEEAVLELSKGWRWSKSQPDNPIARAAVGKKEAE